MFRLAKDVGIGLPKTRFFKLGIASASLQAFSAVALLAASAWLISRAAQQPPVMYLMVAVVSVRAFALGKASFRYAERVFLHEATLGVQTELRPRLFSALIPFALDTIGSPGKAKSVATLVDHVTELQNLPTRVASPAAQATVVSVCGVVGLWLIEPKAAVALAIGVLFVLFVVVPIGTRLSASSAKGIAEDRATLFVATHSRIERLEISDAFGWNGEFENIVREAELSVRKGEAKLALSAGISQAILTVCSTLITASCAYFVSESYENNLISGVLVAVVSLTPLAIFDVLQNLIPAATSWQRYRASQMIISAQLNRTVPEELRIVSGDLSIDSFESLQIEALSARYPQSSEFALKDFNLQLRAGGSVALVGPSGSGKSTAAKVLMRAIEPSTGTFKLNERPVASFKLTDTRRIFGYLEQKPTIFLGTVRENLLVGDPGASDHELLQILGRVGLADTFMSREGLDTWLSENGSSISGGEAQRLALARALLANFEVLVLDEPTANVDALTAKALLDDILRVAKVEKRSVILITHQPELAMACNSAVILS